MTCPRLLARLKAAEARLAHACAADRCLYVSRLFLHDIHRDDETLPYDVRRDRFLTVAWPDWFEEQKGER